MKTTRQGPQRLQGNAPLPHDASALGLASRRLKQEVTRLRAREVENAQAKLQCQALLSESGLMQDKLRRVTRQMITAHDEDRKRISRELHDGVVQPLVGINVALSALSRRGDGGPQRWKQNIARTQRLIETAVRTVHRFSRDLRPAMLDDLGLIPALHAYSKRLAAHDKIRIQMTASRSVEGLSLAKRTVLFRVAQEALNNVIRHAQATEMEISLTSVDDRIRMKIVDNGKSFPVRKTLCAKSTRRLGLIRMRERIEMIGGSFAIESTPGLGTTVRTEIPFQPEKATA